ncbi:hypothetical protein KM043_012325 [Ampulex compressa]|nr:hypothetical protein KM043_012325 [Ampulex compressa]
MGQGVESLTVKIAGSARHTPPGRRRKVLQIGKGQREFRPAPAALQGRPIRGCLGSRGSRRSFEFFGARCLLEERGGVGWRKRSARQVPVLRRRFNPPRIGEFSGHESKLPELACPKGRAARVRAARGGREEGRRNREKERANTEGPRESSGSVRRYGAFHLARTPAPRGGGLGAGREPRDRCATRPFASTELPRGRSELGERVPRNRARARIESGSEEPRTPTPMFLRQGPSRASSRASSRTAEEGVDPTFARHWVADYRDRAEKVRSSPDPRGGRGGLVERVWRSAFEGAISCFWSPRRSGGRVGAQGRPSSGPTYGEAVRGRRKRDRVDAHGSHGRAIKYAR